MAKPIYSDMVFQTENSFCFFAKLHCCKQNVVIIYQSCFIEKTKYMLTYCNLIVLF